MTALRRQLMGYLAGQFGRPHGLVGRGVAILLNRTSRRAVEAAVQLSAAAPGEVVADIGFGGGVGLGLLLDRVGDSGAVHGIDISADMLARASSHYSREVAAGRLKLTKGSLTRLPLADGCLGAAITVNTLYFVPALDQAFAELFRVLKPRGRLVVGLLDPEVMARLWVGSGVMARPVAEIAAAVEHVGFELVEQREITKAPFRFHLLAARR
ncbi:class I SAM-dependent methyltransferase [Mycobacterium sp.]|uniref:class I SAM-dependent methyltransferase n=1 Tax=Mycobacterium sp. TaxID=1785 RepID=UPI003C753B83